MVEPDSASTQALNLETSTATLNASLKSKTLLDLASITTKGGTSHLASTLYLDTLEKETECLVVRSGLQGSSGEGVTVLVLRTTRFQVRLGNGVQVFTEFTIDFMFV
jgi:hypothetical protein